MTEPEINLDLPADYMVGEKKKQTKQNKKSEKGN